MQSKNDISIPFHEMASNNLNHPERFFKLDQCTMNGVSSVLEWILSQEDDSETEFNVEQWLSKVEETVQCFCYPIVNLLLIQLFCNKMTKVKIDEGIEYYFFDNFKFGKKTYSDKIKEAINSAPKNTFNSKTIDYFNTKKIEIESNNNTNQQPPQQQQQHDDHHQQHHHLVELLSLLEAWRYNTFPQKKDIRGNNEEIRLAFIKRLFITCLLKDETKIEFAGAFIQEESSDFLFDSLALHSKIKELNFRENAFGLNGMLYLGASLSLNSSFTTIDLSRNYIDSIQLDKLRLGLSNIKVTNLKYLNISDNAIEGIKGGKAVGQLLEFIPNLKHLNLNKNPLEKGGVYLFSIMIKLMKANQFNLKRLIISKTLLEASSLKLLSEVIKHPNCKLELLSLNENNLNNHGGVSVLKSLQFTRTIRELYLYYCSLSDNHYDLIKGLIISNKIDWINIHKNSILNPKEFLELLALSQIIKDKESQDCNYQEQLLQYFDISDNKQTEFRIWMFYCPL